MKLATSKKRGGGGRRGIEQATSSVWNVRKIQHSDFQDTLQNKVEFV